MITSKNEKIYTDFETLDPKDWEEAKKLMHQMIDDAADYTSNLRDQKIWQKMPKEVLDGFNTSVPTEPSDANAVYEDFKKNILPYPMGNAHPYSGRGIWVTAPHRHIWQIFGPQL